jgi:putative mRNA 3-end processing factor
MHRQLNDLLQMTPAGLYCPEADMYIDPWHAVDRAVITHAHSDHARSGHRTYLATPVNAQLMKHRLGSIQVQSLEFGEQLNLGSGVKLSLHPAGHMPGSAQVLLEHKGFRTVVSGDYKRESDPLARDFETQQCHSFITESTFGLPIYQWPDPEKEMNQLHSWWRGNAANGVCSVVSAYSLGKAQRVLAMLDPDIGPIYAHGAIYNATEVLRGLGYELPPMELVSDEHSKKDFRGSLVMATPSGTQSTWMRRFDPYSLAFCSGWMMIRGPRRRRAADRGFVISDHADWDGLIQTIRETQAEQVWVTHGYSEVFARWLGESESLDARPLDTRFMGERAEIGDLPQSETTTEG